MPWEHPWLYPIQTILLTMPIWGGLLMPVWSFFGAKLHKVSKIHHWVSLMISICACSWALGLWAPNEHEGTVVADIVVANVNAYAPKDDQLAKRLSLLGVDYVVLLEKRVEEIEGMNRRADDFAQPVKKPSHHTAVFCQQGCKPWISPQIGSDTMAMSLAVLPLQNNICMIGVHIPPPTPIDATGMRPYVEYIESAVENGRLLRDWSGCQQNDAVLIAGDLNGISGGWAHTQLINLGLVDAQRHTGVYGATWPSDSDDFIPLSIFRIDHVLHHPSIRLRVKQIYITGSDHQGLWIQLLE